MIIRWIHFLAGITWIGLLYFFNLINAAFLKSLDGSTKNAVIPKLMPSALNWFRHGATVTVLAGSCCTSNCTVMAARVLTRWLSVACWALLCSAMSTR